MIIVELNPNDSEHAEAHGFECGMYGTTDLSCPYPSKHPMRYAWMVGFMHSFEMVTGSIRWTNDPLEPMEEPTSQRMYDQLERLAKTKPEPPEDIKTISADAWVRIGLKEGISNP